MIQTETSKAKIIFVSVPNGARDFRIATIGSRLLFRQKETNFISDFIDLPQGNWTIINVLDDVTEDESEIIVEQVRVKGWKSKAFKNYKNHISSNKDSYIFADQSLHSLATSLGVEGKTIIIYELK